MEAEKNYHTWGEAEDDTGDCEEGKQKENDKGADKVAKPRKAEKGEGRKKK